MNNNTSVVLVVRALALFAAFSLASGCRRMGELIDTWQTSNGVFKLRIRTYEERGTFLAGMYYKVEASSADDTWIHVLTFRDDDQRPIPHEQTKFLNASVGYVFIGWVYAVTAHGGRRWTIWSAKDDLADWQCCNYKLIRSVDLHPDGTGTMTLNPKAHFLGHVPELHTSDFGRHWTE